MKILLLVKGGMFLASNDWLRENEVVCLSKLVMEAVECPWEDSGNMAVRWVGGLIFQRISHPSETLGTCHGSLPSHPQCSPELVLDDKIFVQYILPQLMRTFKLRIDGM